MDNALLVLYLWLTFALVSVSGMSLISDAPPGVSLLRATFVSALPKIGRASCRERV